METQQKLDTSRFLENPLEEQYEVCKKNEASIVKEEFTLKERGNISFEALPFQEVLNSERETTQPA